MTWKEKLEKESPSLACGIGGGFGCPHMHFKEATKPVYCDGFKACDRCWNRTIPGTESEPAVKNCSNCKFLSRDVDQEPCKSCDAVRKDPTNWVYRDNSDLEYNRETDSWKPKQHQLFGGPITMSPAIPEIERVIFSDPATIVFWKDGTKTVVKAHNEEYDPEKGLAMAMIKKLYGNKGNYCNKLKKWTDKYRYYGETPAEKAERRDKQIREKLAYAEVMLDSIINEKSKMTKADLRALAKDTRELIGEVLED